ncbi:PEP-CTERM sorting domain-containing protein [Marinobacter sp. SS5-14b]|uniref:PEP-CTERM sorting domain-containing protein n=1 Tax=Marinobacter sp. SS5-14b TaxID=3050456 RepID=UPI0026DF7E3C|nr:PEP-CTERM sorting domain-containing protein [Marinobacter sp. SS5-14b]
MFFKKVAPMLVAGVAAAAMSSAASAGLIGFTNSPTTNSVDFANQVALDGGTISVFNFDDHALGALNSNQYSGFSMSTTGSFGGITYGAGPGQGNTSTPPLNSGEGAHAASNYLLNNSGSGTFTISFQSAVSGFGLDIIDFYNPDGSNDITISAYGTNGLLGSYGSYAANFQPNNMYFMGVLSDALDITSIVISDDGALGDSIGYDNLRVVTGGTVQVPEPGSLALLGLGLVGFGVARRKARG